MKEDLLATLEQLVLHKDRFDYVLIETTGLCDINMMKDDYVTSF